MEWIILTNENLPDTEVLATNGRDYLVGYVNKANVLGRGETFICDSGDSMLYDVTYYAKLSLPKDA